MITRSTSCKQLPDWQQRLRQAYRSPEALLRELKLDPDSAGPKFDLTPAFPFRVTREFAARMQAGNWRDPLLAQVLPLAEENRQLPGFVSDPLAESAATDSHGVLQKYHGRVLLVTTAACAIHCRYCFRREFPYTEVTGKQQLEQALASLAERPEISEVILSGGDPLMLNDQQLKNVLDQINRYAHVQRIRIHTRLPVVLPQRVTPALLQVLRQSAATTVVVIHANHANELDTVTTQALLKLRHGGTTVLNQSVLLAGINNNIAALTALSERLFAAGVLPYYMHMLDPVCGTHHFAVDEHHAGKLAAAMRQRLPGYLVPQFVREQAGATSKTPLAEINARLA